MTKLYTVAPGDCLSAMATRHGFASYKAIYDHPDNADFKKKRPNPNLIHPGDVVVVPDREDKTITIAAGKTHRFQAKRARKTIHVRVQDLHGEAMRHEAYLLEVGGDRLTGETDGDGVINEQVPATAKQAILTVGGLRWTLRIGELNPIDDTGDAGVSGVQARLRNLGIDPGPVDGELGPETSEAICVFEVLHGLPITGEASGVTLAKLKEIHGS